MMDYMERIYWCWRNHFNSIQITPYFFFPVITAIGSELLPQIGFIHATIKIHNALLHNTFRQPMQFFDTNPVGRVLSRFSGDIDTLDNDLPWDFTETLLCIMEVNIFLKLC